MKKKLLISFSGGETSGYMLWWVLKHKRDEYDIKVVFANTGNENEETLLFVKRCSEHFNVEVIWVEAVPSWTIDYKGRKVKTESFEEFVKMYEHENKKRNGFHCIPKMYNSSTGFKQVTFETASRKGEPFEKVIQRYGVPNPAISVCTRELKERPIAKYCRSIGWKSKQYYLAIGIRVDEIDRVNDQWRDLKIYYPLVSDRPMSKPKINFWWRQQPFRLNLKGYQGNCKDCFKKTENKLLTIAKEDSSSFDFTIRMTEKYKDYIPYQHKYNEIYLNKRGGKEINFFRGNKTPEELIEMSKVKSFKAPKDDSDIYEWEGVDDASNYNACSDSCEVMSNGSFTEIEDDE